MKKFTQLPVEVFISAACGVGLVLAIAVQTLSGSANAQAMVTTNPLPVTKAAMAPTAAEMARMSAMHGPYCPFTAMKQAALGPMGCPFEAANHACRSKGLGATAGQRGAPLAVPNIEQVTARYGMDSCPSHCVKSGFPGCRPGEKTNEAAPAKSPTTQIARAQETSLK